MYRKNETWLDGNENITIDSWNINRIARNVMIAEYLDFNYMYDTKNYLK